MIVENCPKCGGTHIGSYDCPYTPEEAAAHRKRQGLDPRDPDPSRPGIFRDHNCWKCKDGAEPCVKSNPRQCEYPHARND